MRLLDKRYEEIKRSVVELFVANKPDTVPIDCFKICNLLGIVLVKYSEVNEKNARLVKNLARTDFVLKKK